MAPGPCWEVQSRGQISRVRPSWGVGAWPWAGAWGAQTWTSWAALLGGTDGGLRPRTRSSCPRLPRPITATAMLPPGTALLTLLLAAGSLGRRARGPSQLLSPINTIQPKANFDARQVQLEEVGEQELAQLCEGQAWAAPSPHAPTCLAPSLQGHGSW